MNLQLIKLLVLYQTNSPKTKDIKFAIMSNNKRLQILTKEKLEAANV